MARPVFTYTERSDNLGLCVIQDILMYAFLNDAFDSPYIKSPRDIWRLTDVPDHRFSTPIHFKKEVQETPVFRRAATYSNYQALIIGYANDNPCKRCLPTGSIES